LVYLYDVEKKKLINKLTFHQKGVQSMAFSTDGKYLITLGVQGEDALAVWDITTGLVVKSALIRNYATNQVKVDPFVDSSHI
jgi:WD40 repeat protein